MTNGLSDLDSPKNTQYQDSANLSARADLHQRFSTNPISWQSWVFDQIDLPDDSKILEVGSGPGYLWQQNQTRLFKWDICLSDLSAGMLREAKTALESYEGIRYVVHDACNIPSPKSAFDAVIANHMLYHLPNIPAALKEIKRVLKPGSCLYAATNGKAHMHEIEVWRSLFGSDHGGPAWGTPTSRFSLENGEDLLQQEFKYIRLLDYPDSLIVDQVEPIIRYIRSYTNLNKFHVRTDDLREFLKKKIAENDSVKISKKSGMFVASKH